MADLSGRQIDIYRLLRQLGAGTFGEVYLAENIHDGTQVAVKVLKVGATPTVWEEFLNEARATFRLKHPHIVPLLDFGVAQETPFLVMEYAPHGTLRQRHPAGTRLPLTTIISYVEPIASALQHAHNQRLIHRDVKPSNILVGRNDTLLISDFGVATVAHREQSFSTQEAMSGTLPYMAPEQIQRNSRPASDQYALGVIVYEWLSGERPFQGADWEIIGQHLAKAPPSLRERVSTLPPDVEEVVFKALAKDPQARFQQIQDFAQALREASQQSEQPSHSSFPSSQVSSLSPSISQQAILSREKEENTEPSHSRQQLSVHASPTRLHEDRAPERPMVPPSLAQAAFDSDNTGDDYAGRRAATLGADLFTDAHGNGGNGVGVAYQNDSSTPGNPDPAAPHDFVDDKDDLGLLPASHATPATPDDVSGPMQAVPSPGAANNIIELLRRGRAKLPLSPRQSGLAGVPPVPARPPELESATKLPRPQRSSGKMPAAGLAGAAAGGAMLGAASAAPPTRTSSAVAGSATGAVVPRTGGGANLPPRTPSLPDRNFVLYVEKAHLREIEKNRR